MVRKMDQDLASQGHRLDPADGFHENYFGGVVRRSRHSLQSVEEPGNQAQWHTSPGSIDQQEVTPVEPFPEAEGEIQGHQGGPNGRRPRLLDLPGPGNPDHLVVIRVLCRTDWVFELDAVGDWCRQNSKVMSLFLPLKAVFGVACCQIQISCHTYHWSKI